MSVPEGPPPNPLEDDPSRRPAPFRLPDARPADSGVSPIGPPDPRPVDEDERDRPIRRRLTTSLRTDRTGAEASDDTAGRTHGIGDEPAGTPNSEPRDVETKARNTPLNVLEEIVRREGKNSRRARKHRQLTDDEYEQVKEIYHERREEHRRQAGEQGSGLKRGGGFWSRLRREGNGNGSDDGSDDSGRPGFMARTRNAAGANLGNFWGNERVRRALPYVGAAAVGASAVLVVAHAFEGADTSFSFDYEGAEVNDHGSKESTTTQTSGADASSDLGHDGTHKETTHFGEEFNLGGEVDDKDRLRIIHEDKGDGTSPDVAVEIPNGDGTSKLVDVQLEDGQGLTDKSQDLLEEEHGLDVEANPDGSLDITQAEIADDTTTTTNSSSEFDKDKSGGPISVDIDGDKVTLDSANGPVKGEYTVEEGLSTMDNIGLGLSGAAAGAGAYHVLRNRNRGEPDAESPQEEPEAVVETETIVEPEAPVDPISPELRAILNEQAQIFREILEQQNQRINALEQLLQQQIEQNQEMFRRLIEEIAGLRERNNGNGDGSNDNDRSSGSNGTGSGGSPGLGGGGAGGNSGMQVAYGPGSGGGGAGGSKKAVKRLAREARDAGKYKAQRNQARARIAELEAQLAAQNAGVAPSEQKAA